MSIPSWTKKLLQNLNCQLENRTIALPSPIGKHVAPLPPHYFMKRVQHYVLFFWDKFPHHQDVFMIEIPSLVHVQREFGFSGSLQLSVWASKTPEMTHSWNWNHKNEDFPGWCHCARDSISHSVGWSVSRYFFAILKLKSCWVFFSFIYIICLHKKSMISIGLNFWQKKIYFREKKLSFSR